MNKINIYKLIILLLISTSVKLHSQEVENIYQYRTSATLELKPIKKITLEFTPELRFNNNLSADRHLLQAGIKYKVIKPISFGISYRIEGNKRDTKPTEYFSRYSIKATLKKKFYRFNTSARLCYSNYDDDESDSDYMRYKGAIKYDIPKSKITPFISVEAYQNFDNSDFHKMRYSTGLNYKIIKKSYIQIGYKLDYYLNKYKNRHIISIGYKYKL